VDACRMTLIGANSICRPRSEVGESWMLLAETFHPESDESLLLTWLRAALDGSWMTAPAWTNHSGRDAGSY
jgi:hypothetical protein